MQKNAIIVFTREPEAGLTKTRMMPRYSAEECAELHSCFLRDIARSLRDVDADIWVCYTSSRGEHPVLGRAFEEAKGFIEQRGDGLGARMFNAIEDVLEKGYDSCALIGTDVPELRAESVARAFDLLKTSDIVLGPTEDGGYYLIAMRRAERAPFELESYGNESVLERTIASIESAGRRASMGDSYQDMDETSDLRALMRRYRENGRIARTETGRFLLETLRVSIIVPIYNEETTIDVLQEQLERYKAEAEILIVDGGSTDATCEMVREGFTLIRSEKGRANQMNLGAKMSSGDVLFFLHADSLLPDDLIGEIRRVMQGHRYGCFGVSFPSRNLLMLTNRIISNDRAFRRGLPFCDQGIFMDRELFWEVGGFPLLPLMEDYQFSLNLKGLGYRPGRTKDRITTSSRRYGSGTLNIARTEFKMWSLRRRYRRGEDVERLTEEYKDIR